MSLGLLSGGAGAAALAAQAMLVRRRVPRLPDAMGAREGLVTTAAAAGDTALRLEVIGESSVSGIGIERLEESLVPALARHLGTDWRRPVAWRAHGWSGARVHGLCERVLPRVDPNVDVLVVVVGVNDVIRLTSVGAWETGVERLLRGVRTRLGRVPVAWVGLPQMGTFTLLPQPLRALVGARAGAMNRRTRDVVARSTTAWFVPTPQGNPHLVGADGFHPNAEGYDRWAAHIAACLDLRLRDRGTFALAAGAGAGTAAATVAAAQVAPAARAVQGLPEPVSA